jgi:peptide/nickel transport system ATP-binding protein
MTRLLEVEDLKTQIKLRRGTVHAVDGLSFEVEAGETLGIVGESGCGKTMAAMSIMQLLPRGGFIAGGEIRLEGRDLVKLSLPELRKVRGNEVGMVFQDPMTSLNPTMMIGKQIAEVVSIHRDVSKAQALDRAAEVLDLVGLPRPKERLRDYPHQLSGGLRQRVMIAMALACDPKLLIADEPTTALDVTIQEQILGLLDRIKLELGMGIILITHDMGVIAGRADRVLVMYAGRKVETAETVDLFKRVRHPYTEALLASIPQLDQDKSQELYSIPGLPPDLRRPPLACRFAARCAFATEQCRTHDPPLGGDDPNHPFACFHPRDSSVTSMGHLGANLIAQAEQNKALMASFGKELELLATAEEPVVAGAADTNGRPEFVLEFRDVTKEFPVTAGSIVRRKIGVLHAVSDVQLGIRPRETFGLVGESGCGKTTLGRMGVGLEVPTRGQVLFDGTDIGTVKGAEFRSLRRDLQFMFQDPYASLDPRMRVREIISEPLDIARVGSPKERVETVRSLLDEVGLGYDAMDRYPHEFSGGQRQRLGLARALTLSPKVIIADEPVSALDVSIRSQILNLMKRLQATHGVTYVVISHDLSVVKYLADRIGVMYLGKLVEIGPGNDIYEKPAHPYTAGLLEAIPVPNPEVARGKERKVAVRGELPSPVFPPSGCRFRTRCPRAQEKCAEVEPPLRPFGPDHFAACHFPLQTPLNGDGAGQQSQATPAAAADSSSDSSSDSAPDSTSG